jgi:hypothetical protein
MSPLALVKKTFLHQNDVRRQWVFNPSIMSGLLRSSASSLPAHLLTTIIDQCATLIVTSRKLSALSDSFRS